HRPSHTPYDMPQADGPRHLGLGYDRTAAHIDGTSSSSTRRSSRARSARKPIRCPLTESCSDVHESEGSSPISVRQKSATRRKSPPPCPPNAPCMSVSK